MDIPALIAALSAKRQLPATLKELGAACLDHRQSLAWDKHADDSTATGRLREQARVASLDMWSETGKWTSAPPKELIDALLVMEGTPDLATLTLLEGLCQGAAAIYVAGFSSILQIDRGMVLPLPERVIKAWAATPNPATTRPRDLMDPAYGFAIWESSDWAVELLFERRDRIDEICWTGPDESGTPRLPRLASVHPFHGTDMDAPDEFGQSRFFGEHPKTASPKPTAEDNARTVVQALVQVADSADVAVVPEFTMHDPDAIAAQLRTTDPIPPLVVAGSAHVQTDGFRANTSVTYLDGKEVLRVSKKHAFSYRVETKVEGPLDPTSSPKSERYLEDISPQARRVSIVASTSTRLAVAICSDLNSSDYLLTLVAAGVNVLLCPAWTPRVGTFSGAVELLASHSQAISLVANTPGHPAEPGPTLWALSMVPRKGAHPLEHEPPDGGDAIAAVFNYNELPASAEPYITWLPRTVKDEHD